MSDALNYTCTGADAAATRDVLAAVLAEMDRRAQICADANVQQWDGPKLNLVVDEMHLMASDPAFVDQLARIVRAGRKVGVVSKVRDATRHEVPEQIQAFLDAPVGGQR